jgi:predicted phosphodiesterase
MAKKKKVTNLDENKEEFIELYNSGASDLEIATALGSSQRTVQTFASKLRAFEEITYRSEIELSKENIILSRKQIKEQDKRRVENKRFKDHAKIINVVEELQIEILALLAKKALPKSAFRGKKIVSSGKVGAIIQLSDLHFNELIDLPHNKFDFRIASKRLRKYVNDCKKYLKANGIKDVCIAMTGDLINSDRRLDEKLAQATNRAKAVCLSTILLEQVLLDLQKDFNLSVTSVAGNESRITEDIGWVEEVASDNYDTIIHGMLKQLFKNSNIKFFDGNANERIVEIVGQNVLLQHGHQHGSTNAGKNFQSTKGKLASQGVIIDFIITGHYHNAKNGDTFAQSSSLAGANAYSNDALGLESRASQNLHIFFENGNRDSIKIDLQNYGDIEGYPIDKDLESYNAKSVSKSKKKVIVHRVVS